MQFIDLHEQYLKHKNEIDESISEVLNNSNYIMGKQVEELEMQLAEYVGVKHCITCGNGTDALILSLMTYGIKTGDAVFLPTFTFYATAEAVAVCGATPIFVDIDKKTFCISPADLELAIEEVIERKQLNPRAIIPVDLFGLPYDYIRISQLSHKYNLLVIEDGAQGFGGSIEGRRACALGDISTTSFFPSKPLGGYGDGGAIFTNEEKVSEHIKSLRFHGKGLDKYDNVRIGMNSRLDTLQAAVLKVKLKAFNDYELEARARVANWYNERLKSIVQTPYVPVGYKSSYAQYSILLETEDQRDQLMYVLKNHDIPTRIYYKKPMHQQTVFRNNQSIYRNFQNAELISKTILSLPMHPYLSEDEVDKCVRIIKETLVKK